MMNKEYQEIFERLDVEDKFYNSASEYDQYTRKGIEIAKDIVNDVKTEFASKTDWILCKDKLPNKSGEYLVAVDYYGIGDNAKKNTPRRKVCIKHFWKGEETDTYRNIWQKLPYENFEVIKWQDVPDGE